MRFLSFFRFSRRGWGVILLALLVALAACRPAQPVPQPEPTRETMPTATSLPVQPSIEVTQPPAAATAQPEPTATPLPTAPPTPPEHPIMGVEMHRITSAGGLDLVRASGAGWVRLNALFWSEVEPQEGQRAWETQSTLEAELAAASAAGLRVVLIVRSTPAWAQLYPGVACGPALPEKLPAFGNFMRDLVARYSSPPYNVLHYEFGNEPDIAVGLVAPDNIFGCWGLAGDPYYGGGMYAEMLKAVYPQVKAANPQAQVLVGGLLLDCDPINPPETAPGSGEFRDCTPSRYLEGILQNGGGAFFDGISFHAYDFYGGELGVYGNGSWYSAWNTTGPSAIAKTRYIRSLLNTFGVGGKYLVNSESALICAASEDICQSTDFELTKAYYAAQALTVAHAEGLLANIWYSISGWRNSGLVRNNQPLPAFETLSFANDRLRNAAFLQDVRDYPGVAGYAFSKDGVRLWVLWSRTGDVTPVMLPAEPSAMYDVFGVALSTEKEIEVGIAPVYVELP